MKIIEIADYYNNKTGNPLSIISESLKKKGFDVTVVTSNIEIKPNKMTKQEDQKSIVPIKRFKAIKIGSKAIFLGAIPFLLKQEKNTIIHAHVAGFYSPFICAIIKKIIGFKLVITSDFDTQGKTTGLLKTYYDLLFGWPLNQADIVLCWTKNEKETIHKRFKVPLKKMKIIPIGYFQKKITPNTKKIDKDNFVVLSTCFLSRKKNIEMIINAIKKTRDKKITLLHAGGISDLDYKKELDTLIKKNGMETQVTFLGKKNIDEIYKEYPKADIYVNSGFRESYCIPIIEAMASGIPVISTKTGIAVEIIKEGQTGFFIENETELAETITLLKKNRTIGKSIAQNAKKEVKKFEWNKIIKRYETLFKSIKE
jgi:glycosyltransferase involved in cell wall biosynthesis